MARRDISSLKGDVFAIAFDMVVSDLKKNYGEPYNNAYFAIGGNPAVNMDSIMREGVS